MVYVSGNLVITQSGFGLFLGCGAGKAAGISSLSAKMTDQRCQSNRKTDLQNGDALISQDCIIRTLANSTCP